MGEGLCELALLDTYPPPAYQRIARKAVDLEQPGLTLTAIARRLGVTDKTVAKALRWLRGIAPQQEREGAPL